MYLHAGVCCSDLYPILFFVLFNVAALPGNLNGIPARFAIFFNEAATGRFGIVETAVLCGLLVLTLYALSCCSLTLLFILCNTGKC
jgi:hypothetical protein